MTRVYLFKDDMLGVRRHACTWRGGEQPRHLSLWSIVHRFCRLNAISGQEFKRIFRHIPVNRHRANHPSEAGSCGLPDLRLPILIDTDQLGEVMGEEGKGTLATSAAHSYLPHNAGPNSLMQWYMAANLRFCPTCMRRGVHMIYHQFWMVRRCPVHGDRIVELCPTCRSKIPYTIPMSERGFDCQRGHRLSELDDRSWHLDPDLVAKLEKAGDWMKENLIRSWSGPIYLQDCYTGHPDCDFSFEPTDNLYPWALDLQLPTVWHALRLAKTPLGHNCDPRIVERSWFLTIAPFNPKAVAIRKRRNWYLPDEEYYHAGKSIYKAICRHFYRRMLRNRRSSIRAITMESPSCPPGWEELTLLLIRPLFDPLAFAFVIWKSYWEMMPPEFLFDRRTRLRWYADDDNKFRFAYKRDEAAVGAGRRWERKIDEESLQRAIAERKIAVRCVAVFDEILARIEACKRRRKLHYFAIESIDGRYNPLISVHRRPYGCDMTCFWPAPRVFHAPFVRRWFDQVPSPRQKASYVRLLRRSSVISGSMHPRKFQWPTSGEDLEYFLNGPSEIKNLNREDDEEELLWQQHAEKTE